MKIGYLKNHPIDVAKGGNVIDFKDENLQFIHNHFLLFVFEKMCWGSWKKTKKQKKEKKTPKFIQFDKKEIQDQNKNSDNDENSYDSKDSDLEENKIKSE